MRIRKFKNLKFSSKIGPNSENFLWFIDCHCYCSWRLRGNQTWILYLAAKNAYHFTMKFGSIRFYLSDLTLAAKISEHNKVIWRAMKFNLNSSSWEFNGQWILYLKRGFSSYNLRILSKKLVNYMDIFHVEGAFTSCVIF